LDASTPNPTFSNLQGILIERKKIHFHCNISRSKNDDDNNNDTSSSSCILDAQHLSRHFLVVRSQVSFHKIIFMNGNSNKDIIYSNGGVLFVSRATIVFTDCKFINNTATEGGGMILFNSTI
jgi:hypothetical protein